MTADAAPTAARAVGGLASLGERIALLKTLIEASGGRDGPWRLELASLQGLHRDAHIALTDLARERFPAPSSATAPVVPPAHAGAVEPAVGANTFSDVTRALYGPAGKEAIAPAAPDRTAPAAA